MVEPILFLVGGFVAGMANSVAGGGSLILYPLLLKAGLLPVIANATCNVIVWPGQVTSAIGYKQHIKKLPRRYLLTFIPSFIGGLIGAYLLGHTANTTFEVLVPWFILIATLLMILQPKLHHWLNNNKNRRFEASHHLLVYLVASIAIFAVSIYGGYFGAGFGIMMLAFLGLSEIKDIKQMNGLKNLMAVGIATIAGAYFIHKGLVDWSVTPFLFIGSLAGGYIGATYSSKLPSGVIRKIVIVIGVAVTAVLFVKTYR